MGLSALKRVKVASILHQNCLSDGRVASETPSPHTFLTSELGELCLTISVTFQNQHSHPLHALIGQLCWREKGFELSPTLFFHLLHNYFWHFSCEQLSATLWMPSRRDCWEMRSVISIFKWHRTSSLFIMTGFSLHLQVISDAVGQHVV